MSTITVWGTPWLRNSQAVSAAPWLRGRVSSTQTWTGRPASLAWKTGDSAVPQSTVASQPALQWVSTLSRPFPPFSFQCLSNRPSACAPIARFIATSSSQIAAARA